LRSVVGCGDKLQLSHAVKHTIAVTQVSSPHKSCPHTNEWYQSTTTPQISGAKVLENLLQERGVKVKERRGRRRTRGMGGRRRRVWVWGARKGVATSVVTETKRNTSRPTNTPRNPPPPRTQVP
jgi:hypothetical protein